MWNQNLAQMLAVAAQHVAAQQQQPDPPAVNHALDAFDRGHVHLVDTVRTPSQYAGG